MVTQDTVGIVWPIVERYIKALREGGVRPEHVYLYGSYANGRADRDSDIDVAVVSSDLSGRRHEDMLWLMQLRWDVDVRIEPHPFRPEQFTAENPEVAEILETGVEITVEDR